MSKAKVGFAVYFCLAVAQAAHASTVIMDQIGPNGTYTVSGSAFTSQIFGAPYNGYNLAVLDDFTVSQAGQITEVDAATLGYHNFPGYSAVTSWSVEIYSSVAAGLTSLNGDVASESVLPGAVGLETGFTSDANSALVEIPVSISLDPGTYWLAVVPSLSFSATDGADIGIYQDEFSGFPNDHNLVQVNSGGAWGFVGNEQSFGVDAAYRIVETVPTPEPGSLGLLASALLLIGVAQYRARVRRIS